MRGTSSSRDGVRQAGTVCFNARSQVTRIGAVSLVVN